MMSGDLFLLQYKTSGYAGDSEKALAAFMDSVMEALKKDDKVALVGFGTFDVRERAARTGLNPRTKEPIEIKASKAPAFKAGKAFKDSLN
ncbi:MAG: HU family DNA-binding protein [Eubacterium sp.]